MVAAGPRAECRFRDLLRSSDEASMHKNVDWKTAPKSAVWWAVDADGTAHWFRSPNVAPFTAFWFADQERAPLFG